VDGEKTGNAKEMRRGREGKRKQKEQGRGREERRERGRGK
jgi:hypothetical protein